jgi:hypothetical protein
MFDFLISAPKRKSGDPGDSRRDMLKAGGSSQLNEESKASYAEVAKSHSKNASSVKFGIRKTIVAGSAGIPHTAKVAATMCGTCQDGKCSAGLDRGHAQVVQLRP